MTVTIIGDVLLWLGKLSVCACCALISFALSTLPYYSDPIKYPNTYLSRCDQGATEKGECFRGEGGKGS